MININPKLIQYIIKIDGTITINCYDNKIITKNKKNEIINYYSFFGKVIIYN